MYEKKVKLIPLGQMRITPFAHKENTAAMNSKYLYGISEPCAAGTSRSAEKLTCEPCVGNTISSPGASSCSECTTLGEVANTEKTSCGTCFTPI